MAVRAEQSALSTPVMSTLRPPRMVRPVAENRRSRSEHRHPGQEFAGHGHQLAPDLVLGEAVQRVVTQPSVFGAPVLAAGPSAVAKFQVSELAGPGVGGEAGDAVPVPLRGPPGQKRRLDDGEDVASLGSRAAPGVRVGIPGMPTDSRNGRPDLARRPPT
jgi:hypothetical protein